MAELKLGPPEGRNFQTRTMPENSHPCPLRRITMGQAGNRAKLRHTPESGASLVGIDREKIWRDTVRNMLLSILFVLVGLFAVSVPVSAHHGNASYDYTKTITVKGTVTQWVWSNPHCLLRFDVKDDKGEVQHWVTEASSPVDMIRIGWSSNVLKLALKVFATPSPASRYGCTSQRANARLSARQTMLIFMGVLTSFKA